jgi:hypothetical protein
MSWTDVRERVWTAAWGRLQAAGIAAYGEAILAQPERFRVRVEAFVDALRRARAGLDRVRTLDVQDPRIAALELRYAVLVVGVMADAQSASDDDEFEGPPVALVVGGMVIGLAGIAWAVAAYEYAVHLREQTALLEKELVARVEASREGRALPPSTLSAPRVDGMGAARCAGARSSRARVAGR